MRHQEIKDCQKCETKEIEQTENVRGFREVTGIDYICICDLSERICEEPTTETCCADFYTETFETED